MSFRKMDMDVTLRNPPPTPKFVLPGLMLGAVGALVGPGASSKTMLSLQIAVSRALGIPVAGGLFAAPPEPGETVVITAEECYETLAIRMHAIVDALLEAGEAPPLFRETPRAEIIEQIHARCHVYTTEGPQALQLVRDGCMTANVDDLRQAVQGKSLVILDSLCRTHNGNENDATTMTQVASVAQSLAEAERVAVLFIHHASRASVFQGYGDSQHASRGSSAFVDAVRWVGNLMPMSTAEAKEHAVEPFRKSFVRFDISKANHMAPIEPMWLRRKVGGVLEVFGSDPARLPESSRVMRGRRAK
jgi:RecA-family ATPase